MPVHRDEEEREKREQKMAVRHGTVAVLFQSCFMLFHVVTGRV